MTNLRWCIALALSIFSLQSYALVIVHSEKDLAVVPGYNGYSVNMFDYGYNLDTDVANSVKMFMSFREIIDNGDDRDAGTHEQVNFYGMLWGFRQVTYADVSTEVLDFSTWWSPGEDTCVIWDVDSCAYDAVKSGVFGIGLWTDTTNLALDEIRWELDVTRTAVSEPPAVLLLLLGLFCVGWLRRAI